MSHCRGTCRWMGSVPVEIRMRMLLTHGLLQTQGLLQTHGLLLTHGLLPTRVHRPEWLGSLGKAFGRVLGNVHVDRLDAIARPTASKIGQGRACPDRPDK